MSFEDKAGTKTQMRFDLSENLKHLPAKPGVYLHKDSSGNVIYVGKATSLRSRVRQYFTSPENMDLKTQALTKQISGFEYIITNTEAEALILENTLIKKYRPRFNVMLTDDKTYPYLKITYGETYPRLIKTRTITGGEGSKYFGPYADVGALNRIIVLLNDSYRLKRCSRSKFPDDWRPCLNGFVGACDRYCMDDSPSPSEYAGRIEDVSEFLKGHNKKLVSELKSRMQGASALMDFEEAAKIRDLITSANAVTERQKVDLLSSGNMDICLAGNVSIIAKSEDSTTYVRVSLFFVRDGRLTGREIHRLEAEEGAVKKEITAAFLKQYYTDQTMLPKEILLEEAIDDMKAIEELLSGIAGHKIKLLVPARGDKAALLKLAQKDLLETEAHADELLMSKIDRERAAGKELLEIAGLEDERKDSLSVRPLRIEAYDISHTGGEDSVGAMVVFRGAEKSKKDYRRFKIRTADEGGKSADDYASLQEVLYRRLKRGLAGEKGFNELPNVILVDGGKGHVAAADQIIDALFKDGYSGSSLALDGENNSDSSSISSKVIRPPCLGMVKDDRHRTRGLVTKDSEIDLAGKPELYHLIGVIQEEVHRFAIEYHRGKRGKSIIKSELDEIPGIGEKRKNVLLLKYGGIEAIKSASVDELAQTPGMNQKAARAVFDWFASNRD